MKRILLTLCSILLVFSLTACGLGEAPPQVSAHPSVPAPSITQDTEEAAEEPMGELLLQLTTQQGEEILFALNGSNAANSLYEQLPLSLEIENYGDNEIIFYPPEELDTSDTPMAKGPTGTLAYYAPWGDVVIYYGNCGGVSGLYQLGQAVSGTEHISEMSGVIQLEALDSDAIVSAPAPSEATESTLSPPIASNTAPAGTVSSPSTTSAPPVQETEAPQTKTETPPPAPEEVPRETAPPTNAHEPSVPEENAMRNMQVTAGNKVFSATLEENDAAKAFIKLMQNSPVVIQMSDYSGFEKVGSLGSSLPESNHHITAQSGDIILYNGDQIVAFYGSNSWSYTKLGRIDDLSGWAEALGSGDVTVTFSLN